MRKKVTEKIEKGSAELLVTDQMSDEDIRKKIYGDMMNLAGHESGTGWMRIGTLIFRQQHRPDARRRLQGAHRPKQDPDPPERINPQSPEKVVKARPWFFFF
jgi:hypothetical protein